MRSGVGLWGCAIWGGGRGGGGGVPFQGPNHKDFSLFGGHTIRGPHFRQHLLKLMGQDDLDLQGLRKFVKQGSTSCEG